MQYFAASLTAIQGDDSYRSNSVPLERKSGLVDAIDSWVDAKRLR